VCDCGEAAWLDVCKNKHLQQFHDSDREPPQATPSAARTCRPLIPLSKTGIALGSIFVVTLVMGDFFVVRVMSGGQSASVVSAMKNNIDQLYYPVASAMAVLLVIVVLLMVTAILRVVDIRSELAR